MRDSTYDGLCAIAARVKNPIMRQRIYGLALLRQIKQERRSRYYGDVSMVSTSAGIISQ